jgi:Tol biopolymer transport system component
LSFDDAQLRRSGRAAAFLPALIAVLVAGDALRDPAPVFARGAAMHDAATDETTVAGAAGRIAFARSANDGHEIYVMNPDGSGETRVTDNSAEDFDAAWSPDGTSIVFARLSQITGIYVIQADGSGETGPLGSEGGFYETEPSWSPDGTRIAFSSARHGSGEIFVMSTDGSDLTQLTTNAWPIRDEQPTWSPDGRQLAFVHRTADRESDIYVMNADGTGEKRLIDALGGEDFPSWSPDGTKIAFSRTEYEPMRVFSEIYVMNADGSSKTRLTYDEESAYDPAWSPDGSRIVFTGWFSPNESQELYTIKADGSGRTRLTNNIEFEYGPDWAPRLAHLSVASKGTGGGTVTSAAPGIDCGSDCSELYPRGVVATLTAEPVAGSVFSGWSDACSDAAPTCTVTMNVKKSVTAAFMLVPPALPRGCTIAGTAGNDVLLGTPGPDVICALGGDDLVRGGRGNDVLRLGPGSDIGYGGRGGDRLMGSAGRDRLIGGRGRDVHRGGPGSDTLIARDGVRDLVGGGRGGDRALVDWVDDVRRVEKRL